VVTHLLAASGALDLDDLRACLGEQQRGQRTRQQCREIHDAHSRKRSHQFLPPSEIRLAGCEKPPRSPSLSALSNRPTPPIGDLNLIYGYEVTIATMQTADPVTIGQDVLLG
jgi:hypothetical protein